MLLSQFIYHSPFTMLITFMLTSGLIFLLASAGNVTVLNGGLSMRYHYNKVNLPHVNVIGFPQPLKIIFWLLTFMLFNLGLDYLVAWLKQFFPAGWQLTRLIASLEGNLPVLVQSLANPFLTSVLSFFYIFVFPALILGVYLYLMFTKRTGYALLLLCAVGVNYLLAVPFYLLAPVYETWYYNPQVKLLIEQVYPAFNHTYRFFSGLSNNFPSLHTSISTTVTLLAAYTREKRLCALVALVNLVIVFSTVYLGIHWLTDVLAGLLFANICFGLTIRCLRKFNEQL
ncbi:MAG: phosphatase PAP2 family protein [Bacillota bacterium]|uniref:phosphatase PAP2 family protein n=1 Tax=Desulfurispora thermophila TaxID=265470 RepID=UPI0003722D13|nr:phosphatase PAP2 family protein [Desulfurispora thermophila]